MIDSPLGTGWSLGDGRVSDAFSDWESADRDLRTFLSLGHEFSTEGYAARWQRLSREPSDGEGPDLLDLMEAEVGGLAPSDFEWLLRNLCVRDGVTLYEVYLEKALEDVYARQVGTPRVPKRSPSWWELRPVYLSGLGVDARPKAIEPVIALRDILTHRRGELRTDEAREQYDTHEDGFPDLSVRLDLDAVIRALDALRSTAENVDQVVYRHTWLGIPLSADKQRALVTMASWLSAT